MFYRELPPPDDLSQFTLSFWEFAAPASTPSPTQQEVFPDGCVSIFYVRNLENGVNIVGLSGLYLETVVKSVSAGDTIWGMRISPAALSSLLGGDPRMMIGTSFFGAEASPLLLDGLADQLAAANQLEDAAELFAHRVRLISPHAGPIDRKIAEAVEVIEESKGEVRVDALARQLNLSTRQLQRRFKSSAGLSPKQYIRARRIRATAIDIFRQKTQNWAERAASLGFSDQAHLSHEVVSMTNRSPRSFAENMNKIVHGHIIE